MNKSLKFFLVAALMLPFFAAVAQAPKSALAPASKSTPPAKATAVEGLEIGNKAPEIKLANPSGVPVSLSSLRGKVVLIDFWASWCRPCRMENPNVVQAYNKYKAANFGKKAKGFTVYSISLDKAKENWVQAIKQDGLEWPYHVSDLKWWYGETTQKYNVQGIPTNWLINEKGIIVGKNLRGEALDQALKSLVKK